MYCQQEAFARERIRDRRAMAARRNMAGEAASIRMWQRLAAFSARRAARSQERLEELTAADHPLTV